jgi:hypothetical protein
MNRRKLLADFMGDDVDKWLLENAADFGFNYAKGEIVR